MKFGNVIGLVLLALFILVPAVFGLLGDYFWFLSIGYESVFLTILGMSVGLGLTAGIVFLVFAWINVRLVRRRMLKKSERKRKNPLDQVLLGVTGVMALGIGVAFAKWQTVLAFLNTTPFNVMDPAFSLDIGFYIFSLPFYTYLVQFFAALFGLSIVVAIIAYLGYSNPIRSPVPEEEGEPFVMGQPQALTFDWNHIFPKALPHVMALLGLLFLVIAVGYGLAPYSLLLSQTGVVFGIGFTAAAVQIPMFSILSVLSVGLAILFLVNAKLRQLNILKVGIGLLIAVWLLGSLIGGVVQSLQVAPDEFNLESPFIQKSIQSTLRAYNLDQVDERLFAASKNLTALDLEANRQTIDNIRLWDFRPLKQTYEQLQLFRTYYDFFDIDIDRYQFNGDYKQVMISAREVNPHNLAPQAQTWVNQHLVYTHGYGVVVNPVERKTEEGLPEFFVKDIPPTSEFIQIDRPEIYYGEDITGYSIVKTSTEELDYPSGEKNFYTSYEGTGGVELSDIFRRLVYALKFSSVELFFSNSIKSDSKILLYKNVHDRVRKIAPFLTYDSDPYVVVSEGRLFWILDGYTTTSRYPYSQPIRFRRQNLNYIRNSVKVVVDAYNGETRFYVIDQKDPLIQTYQKIFPGLFLDFELLSDDLKTHIRYPEDLFNIQAEIYSVFHMKESLVFYNKEDVWVRPQEIFRNNRQDIIPYYVIMKLPDEEREEFILMLPFSPRGKENLVGWMAARSDMPNYGKLLVFTFSKQELAFGPLQIEARIDQDTEISQLFTLWGQAGSDIVRGNLLIIPVGDSLLYVESIFLEASQRGTIPELKRVIAAYGNKLTMQPTLKEALDVLFGSETISTPSSPGQPTSRILGPGETLTQIGELYDRAQQALQAGDFSTYAELIESIGKLLESQ